MCRRDILYFSESLITTQNLNFTFRKSNQNSSLIEKEIVARKIDCGSSLSSDNDKCAIELLAPEAPVLKLEQIKKKKPQN
jgi:hypothetical protein